MAVPTLIAPNGGASAVSFLPNTLRDINQWVPPGEFVLDSSIARYRADALIKNGMPQEAEFLLTLLHREELDNETLLLSDNELIKAASHWFQRARELAATIEQIRANHGVRDCASVEIDAVPPDILRNLVQQAIAQHIDPAELAALDREEDAAKEAFNQMLSVYQEVAS